MKIPVLKRKNIMYIRILEFLFLFFMIFNIDPIILSASLGYNGSGMGYESSGSKGSCDNVAVGSVCNWNQKNYRAIKLTLIYYDGKNRKQLGKPYYIADRNAFNLEDTFKANNVSYEINASIHEGTLGDKVEYNIDSIKKFITNPANFARIISNMGLTMNDLDEESEEGIGFGKVGYRMLIEPFSSWVINRGDGQRLEYFTVKEIYGLKYHIATHRYSEYLKWMVVDSPDIDVSTTPYPGIESATGEYTDSAMGGISSSSFIADPTSKYGYNIVNLGDLIDNRKCYQVNVTSNPAICKNTNTTNKGSYTETMKEVKCTNDNKDLQENSKYGKKVYKINNDCSVHCIESLTTYFPGNIIPAGKLGGYFEWPSIHSNRFALTINGKRTCHIKFERGVTDPNKILTCAKTNLTVSQLYGDFNAKGQVKFNDPEYGKNVALSKDYEFESCKNCQGISSSNKKEVENREIVVIKNTRLKLPKKTYQYINKKTKKSIDGPLKEGANQKNYTNIGFGNLPISLKAKPNKKYSLTLVNLKIGANATFSKKANSSAYECKYKVTSTPTESCKCPVGTKRAGKSLDKLLANNTYKSCPDAQANECDKTPPPPDDDPYCPVGTKYANDEEHSKKYRKCLADHTEMYCKDEHCNDPSEEKYCFTVGGTPKNLTEYVLEHGVSYEEAEEKLCPTTPPPPPPPSDQGYYCPEGTKYPNRNITFCLNSGEGNYNQCVEKYCNKKDEGYQCPDGQDISLCVSVRIKNGASENAAINYCKDALCGKDIRIIYRTIDLDNPFPSKKLNGNLGWTSNTGRKTGRYPGYNWNSEILVKNKILNNRGTEGDKLYNKKPLYTIKLSANNIQKIRSYNKNQLKNDDGYSDFTLNCLDNGTKCLSNNFLRNSGNTGGNILTGGTCKNTGKNTFDTCVNK